MLSRRLLLTAAAAATLPGAGAAAGDESGRSRAATYGAAPFDTPHLIPGDLIDLTRVDRAAPVAQVAALTFDDGPDTHEPQMSETLTAAGATATFFAVGQRLRRNPETARRLAAAGHEIGCHSYSHPMMGALTPEERDAEFRRSLTAFRDAGLAAPTWFRPPYGDWNDDLARRALTFGLRTVLWTVDSRDWKPAAGAATTAARVIAHLDPGAVILLHGTRAATAAALPEILAEGRNRGLTFVSMSRWREAMTAAATGN